MSWFIEGINIGFLEFRIVDVIDILIVGFIIYQLYRLLKGSIAFNIFIGLILIFLTWFIVQALDMKLLKTILEEFIGVGVIALLIVFQPEVRRFLLFIGRGSRIQRSKFWRRLLTRRWKTTFQYSAEIKEISTALNNLAETKTGAIIVFAKSSKLQYFANSGVSLNADISAKLLESIFFKSNPLHDGAVIIAQNEIVAAGCILPVSENLDLPSRIGLRHKAAVGITENSDSIAIVVSEETGLISMAKDGKLKMHVDLPEIEKNLKLIFSDQR